MRTKPTRALLTILVTAVLLAAGHATLQVSKSRSFQFFGGMVSRAESSKLRVSELDALARR
ncbi:MAG: hypothetical protein C4521_13835 [Actinobacteria bacterium]|jgi:hypothetical protein|nr:MAG: hypothetical protein C4521_13835 [Actinomycetota bacterium]